MRVKGASVDAKSEKIHGSLISYFSQISFSIIIVDCFHNDVDGTPEYVKPKIAEFFEKWEAVERCFFNNSRVIFHSSVFIYLLSWKHT